MRKTVFIKNAAILTATSLILRFIGIIFKVWLAGVVGSEGIGLYQIVFSVYILAATFATSGICTAVTRLVADELALGSKKGVIKIFRRSIELTAVIALISTSVLFFGADFISKNLLSDARAGISIRILSLSLPFMGISSCIKGYFIARRKATPGSGAQIFEQAVRIAVVMLSIRSFAAKGLEYACAAVLFGDTVAEAASALLLWLLYSHDKKKLSGLSGRSRPPFGIVKAIMHIALPLTAGRYLNSLLRTAENILVPQNLAKYNTSGNALSVFGMIKGMALPILFFPSTLLNSLSTLLIPEMSEAAARGRKALVKSTAERILHLTAIISLIFSAIFFVAGDKIGVLIYKSADVGFLIKALAPIVPLMYLDSVSDGILKGLDQQAFTFRTSVTDSLLRIILIVLIVPRFGLKGFIYIMYFSNILTCGLNVGRLIKVSGADIGTLRTVLLPLITALIVTLSFNAVLVLVGNIPNLVYIILLSIISLSSYTAILTLFGSIRREDIRG